MANVKSNNYKVFVDTTGCSNDWGVHLMSVMAKVESADNLVEYHIIVPKQLVTDGVLTIVPYCLLKAVGKGQVHVHCLSMKDKNLSAHLITALLAQDAADIKKRSQCADLYNYWFILAKDTAYNFSLARAIQKECGLSDDTVAGMTLTFDYIGQT